MAGRLPDTARRGAVGEEENLETKDGDQKSLETKDGEQESLETKDGEQESLVTKERIMREWRLGGQSKSAVCKRGIRELHRTLYSAVNFGPEEEVPHLGSGAAHRRATSITETSGTAAVGRASVGSCAERTSGSNRSHGLWTRSGEFQRAVCKREITVPGGPI